MKIITLLIFSSLLLFACNDSISTNAESSSSQNQNESSSSVVGDDSLNNFLSSMNQLLSSSSTTGSHGVVLHTELTGFAIPLGNEMPDDEDMSVITLSMGDTYSFRANYGLQKLTSWSDYSVTEDTITTDITFIWKLVQMNPTHTTGVETVIESQTEYLDVTLKCNDQYTVGVVAIHPDIADTVLVNQSTVDYGDLSSMDPCIEDWTGISAH